MSYNQTHTTALYSKYHPYTTDEQNKQNHCREQATDLATARLVTRGRAIREESFTAVEPSPEPTPPAVAAVVGGVGREDCEDCSPASTTAPTPASTAARLGAESAGGCSLSLHTDSAITHVTPSLQSATLLNLNKAI